MAPIKVGLMGYGFSTKCFHLPFITPNSDYEVVAFVQRAEAPSDKSNVEAGKHCTVDYPNAKHYRTPKDFFADSNIDLVIVCTSSDTHCDFGEQALNAGKHVVIEKPFTATTAEADKLISLAKEKGKILTVYQNRRYDSDFRTLQHLMALEPSPFGRITEFANHYDLDSPPWANWGSKTPAESPAGGMMYGLGTHSLDQTLLLFGKPKSVTAFLRVLREGGADDAIDDSFTIILQYGGENKHLISTVKTTVVSAQPKQLKYWVRGTNGTFTKEGEDVQMDHLMEDKMSADDPRFGVEPERYHGMLHSKKQLEGLEKDKTGVIFTGKITSKQGSYMDYYRDLAAAIRSEKELEVKPEQSRAGIRIIELAQESARTGKTVEWSEGP